MLPGGLDGAVLVEPRGVVPGLLDGIVLGEIVGVFSPGVLEGIGDGSVVVPGALDGTVAGRVGGEVFPGELEGAVLEGLGGVLGDITTITNF